MRTRERRRIWTIGLVSLGMTVTAGISLASWLARPSFASPVSSGNEAKPDADLVVHEWGTFLGMSGSDGEVLDGMYHEEHALPSFVHARSRDQLLLPSAFLKGETPVIYFYTERPQSVRLGVGFPQGIWTQWYPQAARVEPSMIQQAETPDRIANGRICWHAEIIPALLAELRAKMKTGEIPTTPATSSDALWNFARDVDAAFVKCLDSTKEKDNIEYERFLFYRGLGKAHLPLRLDASRGGTLTLDREQNLGDCIKHVFVLRVENGRASYRYLPQIRPGETVSDVIPSMNGADSKVDFTQKVADDLANRLTESGLFAKESRAMVNTWSNSYFQTDGIRVLFVLPQSWTDAFIPMTVTPRPKQVVRVMVGRLELLSREREQLAESAIDDLASPYASRRSAAFAFLRDQGRYVEPIVRRVQRTTKSEQVRQLCHRLLMTEFVTELRAAVHDAADGKKVLVDPLLLRAHLGRVLRDIGIERESRAESVTVLHELERRIKAAGELRCDNPSEFEIRAAALEAAGLDRSAATSYGTRIQMFANSLNNQVLPATIEWCREWWVGRAYGRCLVRAGDAEQTAAKLEAELKQQPADHSLAARRLSQLLLAYVQEAQGKQKLADRSWSSLASMKQVAPEVKVVSGSASSR